MSHTARFQCARRSCLVSSHWAPCSFRDGRWCRQTLVAPFAAVRPLDSQSLDVLAGRLPQGEPAALITATELAPFGGLASVMRATVRQMVLLEPASLATAAEMPMAALTVDDVAEMLELVALTKPGPFGRRTIEMGRFLGIRVDGKLVGMAGERLKVPGFTEISAVCVASECRGRGYAAALIKRLATAMLTRGETPFLHVVEENASAIALYERLGFRLRRRSSFGVFKAPPT